MLPSCFALLDDNNTRRDDADNTPRSRLYTGYHSSLHCHDAAGLPGLLVHMQAALQQGLHAVSLFGYELGAHLHRITTDEAGATPLAEILLFSQCQHLSAAQAAHWLQEQQSTAAHETGACGIAQVRASVDEAAFTAAITRIHDYIAAGDTYQVNYTYRLHFDAFGAPLQLYSKLRARQAVPYGALICLPDQRCILSFSPELFVQHQQGVLRTQPMKGTAAAGATPEEDLQRATLLAQDEKNRAENLMIVDLLRNDLGRVATNGSVAVPHLFAVERFGQVLQMTSTVTAQLRPEVSLSELVTALFPCGSITGAPKRRSMEIIAELESTPRGLYTGAIGWFDAAQDGRAIANFCLSVPIRTLLLQAPQRGVRAGEMGVGAGIVHDSQAADEYAECHLKARFLTALESDFSLFETIYATQEDGCRHLELHLQRLQQSAAYFHFRFDVQAIRALLAQTCLQLPADVPHRLRLDLFGDGELRVQLGALATLGARVRAFISPQLLDGDDVFLRHKSSCRRVYDLAWKEAEQRGGFDMLFFNQHGELMEGGRSNVFVQLDGHWYTPPLSAGVLPGVMRTVLLQDQDWAAAEWMLTRGDLARAERVVLCNALRGVMETDVLNLAPK